MPRALCTLSLRGLASHGSELTGTGLTTFLRAEVEITCYMKRFIFNGTSPNHMWACPFKITVSHGHAGCGASTAGKERRTFLEISISHDIHCHQSDSMKACSESLKCTARCGASTAGTERRTLLKFRRSKRRPARGLNVKRYPTTPNPVPLQAIYTPPLSQFAFLPRCPTPIYASPTATPTKPNMHCNHRQTIPTATTYPPKTSTNQLLSQFAASAEQC